MSKRFLWVAVLAALASASLFISAVSAYDVRVIRIRDDCDPASFNAAVGPGTCIGNGNTTFQEFIAELTEDQKVGAWRFSPNKFEVDDGTPLVLESRGGETHTFTKVADFGGGFVAPLNTLSGNLNPRSECARVLLGGALAPQPPSATNIFVTAFTTVDGPTAGSSILPAGQDFKFQCCIHPWMRTQGRVR